MVFWIVPFASVCITFPALFSVAVVFERCSRSSGATKKNSWIDDLFLPRSLLLGSAILYLIIKIGAELLQDTSLEQCKVWPILSNLSFALAKYFVFLFLYFKQRVLRTQIGEPATRFEKGILACIQLILVLGSLTGALGNQQYIAETCVSTTTSTVRALYGVGALLYAFVCGGLLHLFIQIIKTHMVSSAPEGKPLSGSAANRNERANSVGDGMVLSKEELARVHKVMVLNKQACMLSVAGFVLTVGSGIVLPSIVSTAISSQTIQFLGCCDAVLDCSVMMLCSPQIWNKVKKIVFSSIDIQGSTKAGNTKSVGQNKQNLSEMVATEAVDAATVSNV